MNKLIFSEGGQPLNLDDLEFMQTSTSSSIANLCSTISDGIYGARISKERDGGGSWLIRWSDGFVVCGGIIAPMQSGQMTAEADKTYYVQIVEERSTPKTFEDGSSHETRSIYRAEVTSTPSTARYLPITQWKILLSADAGKSTVLTDNSFGDGLRGELWVHQLPTANLFLVSGYIDLDWEEYKKNDENGFVAKIEEGGMYTPKYNFSCPVCENLESGSPILPPGCILQFKKGTILLLDSQGRKLSNIPSSGGSKLSFTTTLFKINPHGIY